MGIVIFVFGCLLGFAIGKAAPVKIDAPAFTYSDFLENMLELFEEMKKMSSDEDEETYYQELKEGFLYWFDKPEERK